MSNCIFCQIIKRYIPCYKTYEDEYDLAFNILSREADNNQKVFVESTSHNFDFYSIP